MRRCCDARAMVCGRKKYSTCLLTASCAVISVRSANMQSRRGDHDSTGNTLEASRGALRIVAADVGSASLKKNEWCHCPRSLVLYARVVRDAGGVIDRKSFGEGTRVAVRVDLGGRRIIKTKKKEK